MPQRFFPVLTIVTFILFIILPLITMNLKEDQISELDNSRLMNRTEIGSVDSFPVDFENYFSDRIGFRDFILSTYLVANETLFHTLEHPTYTYGTDGDRKSVV